MRKVIDRLSFIGLRSATRQEVNDMIAEVIQDGKGSYEIEASTLVVRINEKTILVCEMQEEITLGPTQEELVQQHISNLNKLFDEIDAGSYSAEQILTPELRERIKKVLDNICVDCKKSKSVLNGLCQECLSKLQG